ncbi:MAG: YigZ family protein [Chitinophagales bacterium]|nr:YigZ family protein [Chitinophagales bacterium]
MSDAYITLESPAFGEYKEKGSKFLAFAYPFDDEEMLNAYLDAIRSEHHKARHFCYAYQIGDGQDRYRMNDDGEPSGTAGKPIYGQILSFGLTNVLIIVVRYFGGTKLGVSGLIQAYKEAAKAALDDANLVEKYITSSYRLGFDYAEMGHIMNVLKELDIEIIDKSFESTCAVTIQLRHSIEGEMLHKLIARILNKSMEEVHVETPIDFCTITKVS